MRTTPKTTAIAEQNEGGTADDGGHSGIHESSGQERGDKSEIVEAEGVSETVGEEERMGDGREGDG